MRSRGVQSMADKEAQAPLRSFFAQEPSVAAAYLFGSRAQATSRPDSDVDIAVILPAHLTVEEGFWERVRLLELLEAELHPLHVELADLARVPPLLAHEVIRFHASV